MRLQAVASYHLFLNLHLQQEAVTQYQTFLSQNKVVSASANKDAEMVKRVGTRIAACNHKILY